MTTDYQPTPPLAAPPPTPPQPSQKKRRRWPWVLGMVLSLFVGIGIGAASTTNTEPLAAKDTTTNNEPTLTGAAKNASDCARLKGYYEGAATQKEAGGYFRQAVNLDCSVGQWTAPDFSPTTPPVVEDPPSSVLAVGDSADITSEDEDSVTITVSKLKVTTTPYDTDFGEKPKNGYFLIFTVDLEAVATADVSEDEFYVKTADGQHIDQANGNSWDAYDLDDSLGYAELNAGENTSGLIVFDVADRHGELAYAPNYEGGPIVSWKF